MIDDVTVFVKVSGIVMVLALRTLVFVVVMAKSDDTVRVVGTRLVVVLNFSFVAVRVVSTVTGTSVTYVTVSVLCFTRSDVRTEVTGMVRVIEVDTLVIDTLVIVIKSVIVVGFLFILVTVCNEIVVVGDTSVTVLYFTTFLVLVTATVVGTCTDSVNVVLLTL